MQGTSVGKIDFEALSIILEQIAFYSEEEKKIFEKLGCSLEQFLHCYEGENTKKISQLYTSFTKQANQLIENRNQYQEVLRRILEKYHQVEQENIAMWRKIENE